MADTVLRSWFLVIRRAGTITQRIQVRINPAEGEAELDAYAGPTYRDFDRVNVGTSISMGDADASTLATYELTAVTQAWEAQFLE